MGRTIIYRMLGTLGLLAVLLPLHAQEIRVTDDSGSEIRLTGEAERIVTLAPHIVEQLFAIGAGGRIVGTVSYSDYPEAAREIPLIGGYNRFDMETILALKPDLVIGWMSGNSMEQIAQLKALGITVYLDEPRKVDDIAGNMERLGAITGKQQQAAEVARGYRAGFRRLSEAQQAKRRVTIFYQLWHQPLMTINGAQIINDIIELCGGQNIFSELTALTPVVSREAVLAADPEVIIIGVMKDAKPETHTEWLAWGSMRAVKGGHIYAIDPDIIHRASPRMLLGAEKVCGFIDAARQGGW